VSGNNDNIPASLKCRDESVGRIEVEKKRIKTHKNEEQQQNTMKIAALMHASAL
jgi:hypothetical protein